MNKLFASFCLSLFIVPCAFGHGIDGHMLREENISPREPHPSHDSADSKSFKGEISHESPRWWSASLETGWTSRELHYGIDETGDYGAYATELTLQLGNLNLGVWSGFGVGNDFQEWDFTASYNFQIGKVFFIPGYNFRYRPGTAEVESEEAHDDHGHEHDDHHKHHGEAGGHANHDHSMYGHELFFVLGTTAFDYVTPSMNFVWDVSNTPGAYIEFRVDGEISVYKDMITLNPYALLSLNLGYNTTEYYGWNAFQFGLQGRWKINEIISLVGGADYSVAMTALQTIDQGNVFWVNGGVRFDF